MLHVVFRHFFCAAWNASADWRWERCPSVCLSVKRMHCDKTEQRSVQIFILHARSFSLVFWEEEWLVGGATTSAWNFGSGWPHWSKIADFQSIFTRSASAVAPSKKVQLTLIPNYLCKNDWWGTAPSTWNFARCARCWPTHCKRPIFRSISLVAPQL